MISERFLIGLLTILFFVLSLVGAQSSADSPPDNTCVSYPANGICAAYVNYTVYTGGSSIDAIETSLSTLSAVSQNFTDIDPSCVDSYFRYTCSFYYPKCGRSTSNEQTVWLGCQSACEDVNTTCSLIFQLSGQSSLMPNCNVNSPTLNKPLQPNDSCNYIQPQARDRHGGLNLKSAPSNFVFNECPAPFIKDPIVSSGPTNITSSPYCRFGCCVPCPAQRMFYNEGWVQHAFLATDIIRLISAIGSFLILLSYLVLPDKRSHPALLILNMSLAVFLFSIVVLFSISDPERLQCASAAISSDQDNNKLCAVQGALLVFASMANATWSAALIINLHVHTVWNINLFANRYILLNTICWGIPAAVMGTALGLHAIKYEFANLCLLSLDYIFPVLFYPLAALVCPSLLLHLATFSHIAKIAVREGLRADQSESELTDCEFSQHTALRRNHHVVNALRIQWRALLLAVLMCATVLFYWIFYFTQIYHLRNFGSQTAIVDWMECMLTPGFDQNSCSDIMKPHITPFGFMVTAESLVSLVGVWIFLVFCTRSIWRQWNDLIYNVRVRLWSRRRSVEKDGLVFVAL